MRFYKNLTLIRLASFVLIFLLGCQKDPTSWNNQLSAPIAYGEVNFDQLIDDSIIASNTDESLQFVWNKDLIELDIDSLAKITDTTLVNNFSINFNSLTANPGFEFLDEVKYFQINSSNVEIKEVLLQEGEAEVKLSSPIKEPIQIEVIIPKATKGGSAFSKSYEVSSGSPSNPTVKTDVVDFSGYHLDLTGDSGNDVNTLGIQFKVSVAPDGETVTITDQDIIKMEARFKNLIPAYMRGYFGQHEFDINDNLSIDFLNNIVSGSIDIDDINFDLIIENGFDITAKGRVNSIKSINNSTNTTIDLNHPEFGSWHNINPTSGSWGNLQPFTKTFSFTGNNSNIEAFLENIPQELQLDFQGSINPLGNTTGGHDEKFPESQLGLRLEADFPVQIAADQLVFQDTIAVNFDNTNENIKLLSGQLKIEGANYMPLSAKPEISIYDSTSQSVLPVNITGELISSALQSNNKLTEASEFMIAVNLNEEEVNSLTRHQKLILKFTFNTAGSSTIPLFSDYFIDYKVKANAQTKITY